MAEVSVVMLGGKRTGKSSILAGMIEAVNHSKLSECFVIKDTTDTSKYGGLTLERKREILVKLPSRVPANADFMTLTMADPKIQQYNLTFRLPNKPGILTVDFYDVPGEYANPNRLEFESQMLPLIQTCDVFIIAIDTPYLMLAKNSVNDTVNRIQDLQCALQNIIVKDKNDLKMVMFVPVKCEKWAKEGKLHEVKEKVKAIYKILIDSLSYEGIGISIMPIQTVGNIIFDTFQPAQLISKAGESTTFPCHPLTCDTVRVSNGNEFKIRAPYSVKDDPQTVIDGISVPNSWFRVSADKTYSPVNCEQPALHILKFLVDKALRIERSTQKSDDFFSKCASFFNSVTNWWKGIDINAFDAILREMQTNGTIKTSGAGVEIIKDYLPKD